MPQRFPRSAVSIAGIGFALLLAGSPPEGRADAVLGFVESWTGSTAHGWLGGSEHTNPGTGGAGGAGDGFLRVANTVVPLRLGTFSNGPEYAGDWIAANIAGVRVSLNDIGAADSLEIHFSIGQRLTNLWQYNTGFSPPHGRWETYIIDLRFASRFTQIHGSGTFADALSNVAYVHFRHDRAPFLTDPDLLLGDFGIDDLTLIDAFTPAAPTTWGRLKALYK